VPLLDDEGALGVLEVLDKRGAGGFDLRDVELAAVFARQATVAIRSSRVERDTAAILRSVLGSVETAPGSDGTDDARFAAALDGALAAAADAAVGPDDDGLWALADQVARLRAADPDAVELVRELLEVLVRRAERGRPGSGSGRSR
jgi:GAF domain-containing protein